MSLSNISQLDAALAHAARSIPVFPCAISKEPLVKDWGAAASTDEKQIIPWWTRWPEASIGMPCGVRTGRLVIDIDVAKGGEQSLAVAEEEYGPLPETLEARTGGGGRHLYFLLRGLDIRNSVEKLAPGVDIRANGGFVIRPPSPHPSGNHYQWINCNPVAELPQWLEGKLLSLNSEATPNDGAPGERIAHPFREPYLFSRACSYRRVGDDADLILAKLLLDYEYRCEHVPTYTEEKFRSIAARVARRYKPNE